MVRCIATISLSPLPIPRQLGINRLDLPLPLPKQQDTRQTVTVCIVPPPAETLTSYLTALYLTP